MQFGVALRRLKIGEATKTLAMGGYIQKIEPASAEYASKIEFVTKDDGHYMFDVTADGQFEQVTSFTGLILDPILLYQIAYGDWEIMSQEKAEDQRSNPKIW